MSWNVNDVRGCQGSGYRPSVMAQEGFYGNAGRGSGHGSGHVVVNPDQNLRHVGVVAQWRAAPVRQERSALDRGRWARDVEARFQDPRMVRSAQGARLIQPQVQQVDSYLGGAVDPLIAPFNVANCFMRAGYGDIQAQYNLGFMYMYGQGVIKQEIVAVDWLNRAAVGGDKNAQYQLGMAFEFGRGVGRNIDQAIYWYECSALQGHVSARFCLGMLYEQRQEYAQAAFQYRMIVGWDKTLGGNPVVTQAWCRLGMLYERGLGIGSSYQDAFRCYTISSNLGDPEGLFLLGLLHERGVGVVPKNPVEARNLYTDAAQKGNTDAQYRLGRLYQCGAEGVEKDAREAASWYRCAAHLEHAKAQRRLGRAFEYGEGVKQKFEKAIDCYRKAMINGDAKAAYYLSEMVKRGKGTQQNPAGALKLLRKAAKMGCQEAQADLKALATARDVELLAQHESPLYVPQEYASEEKS